MARHQKNINSMWLKTTNEVGASGANNKHDDQKGTNRGRKTIKEDRKGAKSEPNRGGEAYQAWYT
jgi:hypothetical protein